MSLVHASAEAKQSKQKVMNDVIIICSCKFRHLVFNCHNSSKNLSHFQTESDEFEQFFENADFFGKIPR